MISDGSSPPPPPRRNLPYSQLPMPETPKKHPDKPDKSGPLKRVAKETFKEKQKGLTTHGRTDLSMTIGDDQRIAVAVRPRQSPLKKSHSTSLQESQGSQRKRKVTDTSKKNNKQELHAKKGEKEKKAAVKLRQSVDVYGLGESKNEGSAEGGQTNLFFGSGLHDKTSPTEENVSTPSEQSDYEKSALFFENIFHQEVEIQEVNPGEKIPSTFTEIPAETILPLITGSVSGEKEDLANSISLTPREYINKKLQKRTVTELKEEGMVRSGRRAVLHLSGTNKFYVEDFNKPLGEGKNKRVAEAQLVDLDTGEVESGHVLGLPLPLKEEDSKKDFEHEKLIAGHLKSKIDAKTLSTAILIPETYKIRRAAGAMAGKRVGAELNKLIATLTLQEKLAIGAQLARALEILHSAGITHRDIKPDNILLLLDEKGNIQRDEKGCPRFVITDLGTCYIRETKVGEDVGFFKIEYLDPRFHTIAGSQSLRKEGYPPDTDNYMLGLTLMNLFYGQPMQTFVANFRRDAGIEKEDDTLTVHTKLLEWKNKYRDWRVWRIMLKRLKADGVNDTLAKEIVRTLKHSIHPDFTKRPTLDQIASRFDDLYEQHRSKQMNE